MIDQTARPRIEDVARLASVSTATVSRALSNPQKVSPATRERVRQVIAEIGYIPDAAGRALASGRTHTVGCVIPTLDHAIFARATQSLQSVLAQAGYQLLVATHEFDPAAEVDLVRALQQRGVDAIVLVGTDHAAALWRLLRLANRPVLLTWSCDPRFPSVGFDNESAASVAAEYLLDLGHRRIGILSGHTPYNDRARSRIKGVQAALAAAGIGLAPELISEQAFTLGGGRQGLQALLALPAPPTAIICGNDLLAVGALLEAQRRGMQVPSDISICGFDDHELASEMNPPLTTVALPTAELGRITGHQVLAALRGEPIPAQSLLPFELLVRGTTAAPGKSV